MSGAEVLPFLSLGLRAVKISWEIYNLTTKFLKAPEIIQAHAKDLEVFGNLLQILQITLQSNWNSLSPRAQEVVSMTVINCEDIFAELDALVDQLRMTVKDGEKVVSFSRRKLLMKESSVQLLMLRLGGAKSNVGLLLQLLPPATVQSAALLSVPLPTTAEAIAENEQIIENMDAIEDEHPEGGVSTMGEDDCSIYTFATARTSNTVSLMQDAILSIPDSGEIGLDRQENCPLDFDQLFKEALPNLESLRTTDAKWELTERYVSISITRTQKRIPRVTLKQLIILKTGENSRVVNPAIFDYLIGLQVSACTGNVRRVPLRCLLADVIPAYMGHLSLSSEGWETLRDTHGMLDALQGDNMFEWYRNLSLDQKNLVMSVVNHVLVILKNTGMSPDSKSLVLAWPHEDNQFLALRIARKRRDFWAETLADSPRIAIFAYITSECIETASQKCQQLVVPPISNFEPLVRKSLSLVVTRSNTEASQLFSTEETPAKSTP